MELVCVSVIFCFGFFFLLGGGGGGGCFLVFFFVWFRDGGGGFVGFCTFGVFCCLVTLIGPVSEIGFCIPYQTEEFYCILFVYQQ